MVSSIAKKQSEFNISHLFTNSLCYFTHRQNPTRCYHSGSVWTWEQWQRRCTPHSPNLQGWSLAIRSISYPEYPLEGIYPSAEMQCVYSTTRTNWALLLRGNIIMNFIAENLVKSYNKKKANQKWLMLDNVWSIENRR